MKKTYKKIQSLIVCGLMTFSASAQISGVVTINSGAATGGTNYQTFGALATALNTSGVNGPLTVNVAPGTGPYVEQVAFNQIAGTSANTRITINGNGNTLTFNSTAAATPYTLLFNGTDRVTVKNLYVEGTGTTYALVCVLTNDANFNNFEGCKFTAPLNGTSTTQTPFSISGSITSAITSGNGGNYNTVSTSTMSNGYYGIGNYNNTAAPYSGGNNSFLSCRITDFYYYGFYGPYANNLTIKDCIFDRETRTASSSVYLTYAYYAQGLVFEGNLIHKIYESNQGVSSIFYCLYNYGTADANRRNRYNNNIITNIKNNGTTYGIYVYTAAADVYNNTIDYDYAGATTANTMYGIYGYGASNAANNIYNNIITCRRGASGSSRYGIYLASTPYASVDNNVIHMVGGSGNNNIGYTGGVAVTAAAAWNTAGFDLNGFQVDPMYTSASDLHPTNAAINNMGLPMNLVYDQQKQVRNQTNPDIGALEFMTPLCSGTPTISAVASPTYVLCPGEVATMGLVSLNSNAGITYSWSASQTSNVGPWNIPIQGATNNPYVTTNPMTANTWYSVVMTCTVPGGGTASSVGQVVLAGNTTSVVPYYEGFEGIGNNNRLPNCSWSAPTLGDAAKTATTSMSGNRMARNGASFAYFDNSTPGTNYYYTNSITMNSGITYSAALWYATEYLGNTNWTSLEILVGPNQTPAGMVSVASVGPAASGSYKLLSNTFSVPSSGLYYVAIKAVSAAGAAQYLSWDDLSITIPCDGAGAVNSPTLVVTASTQTMCTNEQISLNATGADTYTWSTGALTPGITETPLLPGMAYYSVSGTNMLTGCVSTFVQPIMVNPSPLVFIAAQPATVCVGQPVTLSAMGNASSFLWSNGGSAAAITVTMSSATTYTLIGTGTNGCTSLATQAVATFSLPLVSASSSIPGDACKGDVITLTGAGAVTYEWISDISGDVLQGTTVNVSPGAPVVYTVTGTSPNGCVAKSTITQNVNECVGINEYTSLQGLMVYPNPANNAITVELNTNSVKSIEVMDLTGRVVLSNTSADQKTNVNISALSNGVYYVKIKSNNSVEVIKIVKQ